MSGDLYQKHFIHLTGENLDETLQTTKLLVVFIYTGECKRCCDLNPEFWELVKHVADIKPLIKIGKLEYEANRPFIEQYSQGGFPGILFFRNGIPVEYFGSLEIRKISGWIKSKLEFPVKNLETVEEGDQFIEDREIAIVGFFKDLRSKKANVYVNVAFLLKKGIFAFTSNAELMAKYEAYDSVVIFKKGEERKCFFQGDYNEKELMRFVRIYANPLLSVCNSQLNLEAMIIANPVHLFLLVNEASGHIPKYVDPLREVMKRFRNDVFFVKADPDDDGNAFYYSKLGVSFWECPCIRLIKWTNAESGKCYKPDSDEITTESVTKFLESYLRDEVPRYYPSSKLDYEWNHDLIFEIVTDNFEEIVFDKSKTVVVIFYKPNDQSYLYAMDTYWRVARHLYLSERDDVLIVRINLATNDVEYANDIKIMPTVRLYKKDTNETSDFGVYPTMQNLLEFIKSDGENWKVKEGDLEKLLATSPYCDLH